MSSVTTVSASEALREAYDGPFVEALYYNPGTLFSLVNPMTRQRAFPVSANPGDEVFRWKVHSAKAGAATRFNEGDPHPQSRPEQHVSASEDYTYVWFVLEVSKHAKDALVNGWFDAVEEAMELGKQEMIDLFSVTYLTDSNVGLPAMISATGTYGNITRGSASYFESSEDSTNTTFSRAVFGDLIKKARKPEKKAKTDFYLFGTDVISTYANLFDYTNADRRNVVEDGGKGFDLGFDYSGMSLWNRPVIEMTDMTETDGFGIDASPGNWKMIDRHPLEVRELAPSGYNERLEVSRAIGLFCKNPVKQVRWDASA